MRIRDIIFLAAGFAGMIAGVLLPDLGEPLRHIPTVFIVVQTLLCFLSGLSPDTNFSAASLRGLPRFLALKMLVVPLACWGIFSLVLPEYALGALLLGGTAVGLLAPFFLFMLRGDEVFGTAAFISSSLLMPFTVPLVVGAVALIQGASTTGLFASFLHTGMFLAACLFLPFISAKLIWMRPALARGILDRRYGVFLVCYFASMLVVFSRFSAPLRQAPTLLPQSLGATFLLAALLFVVGLILERKQGRDRRLAGVVCCCAMNNVLMAVTSAQFFGVHEVLMCALYSVPFGLMLVPYRLLAARLDAGRLAPTDGRE